MARTRGPLFSLAASGTIAKLLQFRSIGGVTVTSLPTIPRKPPTTMQQAARTSCTNASYAWADTTSTQRSKWLSLAAARGQPVFALYLQEFMAQKCAAGHQPLIPGALS